ncbi:MAG: hypothetical protein Q8M58_05865 [Anaerolineales bacterium]|nr:hypothetical protein [Anaerolineales bacterium]
MARSARSCARRSSDTSPHVRIAASWWTRCRLGLRRKTIYLYHATTAEPANVPLDVRERLFHSLKLEDYLQH